MSRQKPNQPQEAHPFQRQWCERLESPILNVGSKEDPAKLGEKFNATNLDLLDFDEFTGTDLKKLRNFVHGSVLDVLTLFPDRQFKTVVLGEFLEHCTVGFGQEVVDVLHALLPVGGHLVVTFPLDDRPPEVQHGKDKLKILCGDKDDPKSTTWHQTVWTDELLATLFADWTQVHRETLHYGFCGNGGLGLVYRKANSGQQEQEQG